MFPIRLLFDGVRFYCCYFVGTKTYLNSLFFLKSNLNAKWMINFTSCLIVSETCLNPIICRFFAIAQNYGYRVFKETKKLITLVAFHFLIILVLIEKTSWIYTDMGKISPLWQYPIICIDHWETGSTAFYMGKFFSPYMSAVKFYHWKRWMGKNVLATLKFSYLLAPHLD